MAVPLLIVAARRAAALAAGRALPADDARRGRGWPALGAIGLAAPRSRLGRQRPVGLAAFFVLVNVASLQAICNLLTGRRIDRWEPRRDRATATRTAAAGAPPKRRRTIPAAGPEPIEIGAGR